MPYFELQPGPAVGLDTYIKAGIYQDGNFGNEQTLQTGKPNNVSTYSLMKFLVLENEGGPIPPGATINSAILSLWQWSHFYFDNINSSYLMIRHWEELLCTWNRATHPPGAWEISGAKGATDREQISEDPTTLTNSGTTDTWVDFTLTKIFQKIVNNQINEGFMIIGTDHPITQLWGSDYIAHPPKRPILRIDYSVFDPFPYKSRFLRLIFP